MVKTGIDLIENNLELFRNKRVGLITNPTGVNRELKSTIDILNERTNLVALFSPEHGVRGDLQAGVHLDDYVDPSTGCKVYSLYGKNRKPTPEMLSNLDILCFDIQGVGARFYTYLYTMAYAMMAAKEQNLEFVVMDRPNPVGATEVEGNILDTKYSSFVGLFPIVERYAMTIGELALYFNTEFGIHCKLHVIKMEGYRRNMFYEDTLLPWVFPSPNIPTPDTAFTFLATCYFEGTNVSEGRGTTKPFSLIGAPWFNQDALLEKLTEKNLPGIRFRKASFTPTFSKHTNVLCRGIELHITDRLTFKPVLTGFVLMTLVREIHPQYQFLAPSVEGGNRMIDLLVGDDFIRKGELSMHEIIRKLHQDQQTFSLVKERYHLYE